MKCLICSAKTLEIIYKVENFPISMGVVPLDYFRPFEYETLDYCYCKNCYQIQIRNKIPPEKLYATNHNTEIVGKIWADHYNAFCKFLEKHRVHGKVLEVGDPSAKIASLYHKNVKTWDIIEPNPARTNFNNVHFIKGFFDKNNEILRGRRYDTVVHSHVFEHMNDVQKFISDCSFFLPLGGKICFSTPNMESILNSPLFVPTNILNFEHVFLVSKELIQYVAAKCNLKVAEIYNFNNHSWFVCLEKIKCPVLIDYQLFKENNQSILSIFIKSINKMQAYWHNTLVPEIGSISLHNRFPWLDKHAIYLYGAHVNTQLVWNCLKQSALSSFVNGILDNSKAKQGKKLYGIESSQEIPILPPEEIRHDKCPLVICSHTGPYIDEIKKQINTITNGQWISI